MNARSPYRPEDLLQIETLREEGAVVYRLSGELDAVSAGLLRDALTACLARGDDAVVDLSALEFVDSSGLGVLVGARKKFDASGSSLTLRAPRPSLQRVLEMTGLTRTFLQG